MSDYIKKTVEYYTKLYKTRDPFELADYLNIEVQFGDLGDYLGCYLYLKKHRCIFINKNLDGPMLKTVMAHELGHAIFDTKENCYFINKKTLLLTSKIERRVNIFTAELIITDEMMNEFRGYTIEQITAITGLDENLIMLKYLR